MNSFIIFKTLCYREVKRFLNVYNQTLISPIINALLYFAIFTVVFASRAAEGMDYKAFVACGIIAMSILQNSYANTQSTITTAKILGFAVDVIIPPISSFTLLCALLVGGIIRGLLIGAFAIVIFAFFVDFAFANVVLTLFYAVFASALFSLIGIIVGCLSKNFDTSVSYNTYIINPLTFLSGTFYSVSMLPEFWQKVILYNPIFYIIEGFRFALTGVREVNFSIVTSGFILCISTLLLMLAAHHFVKTKYHEI